MYFASFVACTCDPWFYVKQQINGLVPYIYIILPCYAHPPLDIIKHMHNKMHSKQEIYKEHREQKSIFYTPIQQ